MDEKNLLICDKEFRYANALGENIMQRSELVFRVFICTSLESVLHFGKEREIHVLIIDERFSREEREQIEAQYTFVLTKEKCNALRNEEKEIKKFQSSEQILAEVLETFVEKSNTTILKNIATSKQKILAVYSPIHRIGKTAFAIGLGKEFAKKEKTLYLNLEDYADVGGRFACSEGRNLGDLHYYMRQEEGNMALRLSTMVMKIDELDYIPPMLMSLDLREITPEEWKQVISGIFKETNYEIIILDLGESIQGVLEVLQLCDRIYMPILEDAISRRKIECFEAGLKRMHISSIESKIYKFRAVTDMPAYARKMVKEEGENDKSRRFT